MATLTKTGRIAMAKAVAALPIFMSWGEGDGAWMENPPAEDVTAVQLMNVVGYRKATLVTFCNPAADGDIIIPSGRFSVASEPTNHLYLKFIYNFEDATGKTIREVGVRTGVVPISGLPEGQEYFLPAEIESPGDLLLLENRQPTFRDLGVRETYEFVVTF